MKYKWFFTAFTFSIAINAAVFFIAGFQWYNHSKMHDGNQKTKLYESLKLTESQNAQIEQRKKELVNKVNIQQQKMVLKRTELLKLLSAPQPDMKNINAKSDEISQLQRAMQGYVIDHLLSERNILKPEQQKVFFEIMKQQICPSCNHGPEDGFIPFYSEGHAGNDGH